MTENETRVWAKRGRAGGRASGDYARGFRGRGWGWGGEYRDERDEAG